MPVGWWASVLADNAQRQRERAASDAYLRYLVTGRLPVGQAPYGGPR